jgi:hypothetical protein
MNLSLYRYCAGFLLLGIALSAFFAAFVTCISCGAPQTATVVAQQADVAAYAAEQQACVANADARSGADSCIAKVKARWCGPGGQLSQAGGCGLDGGSVTSVTVFDGGHDARPRG